MKAATLFLLATLTGNPCANPAPTAECENALAEQALYWESKYLEERLAHLNVVKACSEMMAPADEEPADEPTTWVQYVVLGVVGVLAGGATVAYAATR
jgi:hypothetical protein